MNTKQTLSRQCFRYAAFAVGWLATALAMNAQGTGTIQGRVYNPTSQEYVRNAEVRLGGTNQVTYTENDGTFTFANVPAGVANVTITYTGYNTATETINVAPGQVATREVNLVSTQAGDAGVVQLQAFTVSTEREGNAKAIMDQRRNMNITTSVASDIFGDVTDGNIGEFLKYLPGVDVDYVESETRGPRLGGMDAQYVGVSFDGMTLASADANHRRFGPRDQFRSVFDQFDRIDRNPPHHQFRHGCEFSGWHNQHEDPAGLRSQRPPHQLQLQPEHELGGVPFQEDLRSGRRKRTQVEAQLQPRVFRRVLQPASRHRRELQPCRFVHRAVSS